MRFQVHLGDDVKIGMIAVILKHASEGDMRGGKGKGREKGKKSSAWMSAAFSIRLPTPPLLSLVKKQWMDVRVRIFKWMSWGSIAGSGMFAMTGAEAPWEKWTKCGRSGRETGLTAGMA